MAPMDTYKTHTSLHLRASSWIREEIENLRDRMLRDPKSRAYGRANCSMNEAHLEVVLTGLETLKRRYHLQNNAHDLSDRDQ